MEENARFVGSGNIGALNMLTVSEEYFGTDDIAAIKNWLSQPGAGLFTKALKNEIVKLQIEASQKMMLMLEPDKERFKSDVESKLRKVMELEATLANLDRAKSKDFKPFLAKVATI